MRGEFSVDKMEMKCEEVALMLKALSHPRRLMIMGHLIQEPKSVGELVELCGISQSQVSQFLTRMKSEGLITSEKDGKFTVYSVADKRLMRLMKTIQTEYCK